VNGVPMFFVAVVVGTAVTAVATVGLMSMGAVRASGGAVLAPAPASAGASVVAEPVLVGGGAGGAGGVSGGSSGAVSAVAAGAPASAAPAAGAGPVEGEVLSGYLTAQTVKEQLTADRKDDAIREMAELLAASGKVADAAELVRVAFAREDQGTTGLGEEIAIPHAKTDAVTAPVVGFARSAEGIEWGAPDGTKARLVFMIAVPEAAAGDEHLRILALLSRKLMVPEFRERLVGAADVGAVLGVLGEIE